MPAGSDDAHGREAILKLVEAVRLLNRRDRSVDEDLVNVLLDDAEKQAKMIDAGTKKKAAAADETPS